MFKACANRRTCPVHIPLGVASIHTCAEWSRGSSICRAPSARPTCYRQRVHPPVILLHSVLLLLHLIVSLFPSNRSYCVIASGEQQLCIQACTIKSYLQQKKKLQQRKMGPHKATNRPQRTRTCISCTEEHRYLLCMKYRYNFQLR